MLTDKRTLSLADIESQAMVELPERDMLSLVNLIALNGNTVTITVANNKVAAQVCAQALASGDFLSCTVRQ